VNCKNGQIKVIQKSMTSSHRNIQVYLVSTYYTHQLISAQQVT